MNPILKRILAVIAGSVTAIVVIFLMEMINSTMYQPPAGVDLRDPSALRNMMASMPAGAYVLVIVGYFLGSFFGGLVASFISGRENARASLIVGLVLLIGGIMNLMMLPGQPMWFIISSTVIYIPLAYLGFRVTKK